MHISLPLRTPLVGSPFYFRLFLAIAWMSIGMAPSLLQAQRYPQYANAQDWQVVSSDNFDFYFAGDIQDLAFKSIRYAELARHEVANLYDYAPEGRYTIFIYQDQNRKVLSHTGVHYRTKESGVFALPDMSEQVVYKGNNQELYQEVKRAVSSLILKEFSHGRRLGASIQSELMVAYANWYFEGMTDYVGQGWTYEDEMWLNSFNTEELLELALEGEDHLNRVVRKSIWHYIGHEYGDQKLAEIIYLVNISHSLESGIISVLGVTLSTLTERWREYIRNRISNNAAGRSSLGQLPSLAEIPLKGKDELISFAYNNSRKVIALYVNRGGKHELILFDQETQNFHSTGIRSSFANFSTKKDHTSYPLAWSKDGNTLATTRQSGHDYEMVYFDLNTGKAETYPVGNQFNRVLSLDWSHNGELLAVSALHQGRTDLFIGPPGSEGFVPITQDAYDEVDPCWSFDDQAVFFSSNRDEVSLSVDGDLWEKSLYQNFDLYMYSRDKQVDSLIRLTQTPEVNERYPFALNSFEVVYRSDESGILNLSKVNIFLKETSYLSDLGQGLLNFQVFDETLLFSTVIQGEKSLFSLNMTDLPSVTIPQLTLLRMEWLAKYTEAQKKAEAREQQLLEQKLLEEASPPDTLPEESDSPILTVPSRTNKPESSPDEEKVAEEKEKPVRYYIFDEEDDPYEVKKSEEEVFSRKQKALTRKPLVRKKIEPANPLLGSYTASMGGEARGGWFADQVTLALGRQPDAGYYAGFGVRFTDRLRNQYLKARVTPYLDFGNFRGKNGHAIIRYSNLKGRIDWFAELEGSLRHYRRENTLFPQVDSSIYRYANVDIRAGIRYPISQFSHLFADASFYSLSRTDQKVLNQNLQNQSDQIIKAGLGYAIDKVEERDGYAYKGFAGHASFYTYYSLPQSAISFNTINLGFKAYHKLYKHIVLAAMFNSSVSFGNNGQQHYMGGIDDWIIPIFFEENNSRATKENSLSTDLSDFSFQNFVTPVRGFWFYSRQGSKFASLNTELRIPISRMVKSNLNSNPLYSIEIIPFLDVGSVWTSGVPFSQKNPTDTQLISNGPVTVELQTLKSPFVVGFGTGFRTNFLGYSVRMDIAWGVDDNTLQRPVLSIAMGKNF